MGRNSDRNDKVLGLVSAGRTYSQIAEELGISRNTVAGVVHRNGLASPREGLTRSNDSDRLRKRVRYGSAPAMSETIGRMAREGKTPQEISKLLGLGRQSVVNVIKSNDFPLVNGHQKNSEETSDNVKTSLQVRDALDKSSYNTTDAAKYLGWDEDRLHSYCKQHKIEMGGMLSKEELICVCALAMKKADNATIAKIAWVMNTSSQRVWSSLSNRGIDINGVSYIGDGLDVTNIFNNHE